MKKQTALPTDERLALYRKGSADAGLEALYFQLAVTCLISSSRTRLVHRPTCRVSGIKNCGRHGAANYTTNINVQMNYWPAESTNFQKCICRCLN